GGQLEHVAQRAQPAEEGTDHLELREPALAVLGTTVGAARSHEPLVVLGGPRAVIGALLGKPLRFGQRRRFRGAIRASRRTWSQPAVRRSTSEVSRRFSARSDRSSATR